MSRKKQEFNLDLALKFRNFLLGQGYSPIQTALLLAQAANESNGFSYPNAQADNNYAGLKYWRTFGRLASPSTFYRAPGKEEEGYRRPYAHFDSMSDFVKVWARLAHLNDMVNDNTSGPPLQAATVEEYAHRLKLNHYYQDPESVYLKNLKFRLSQLAGLGLLNDIVGPATADPLGPFKRYLNQTRRYVDFTVPFGPSAMILSLAGPAVEKVNTIIRKAAKMTATTKKLSKIQRERRTKEYPSIPDLTAPFNGLAKSADIIGSLPSSIIDSSLLVNRNTSILAYEAPDASNGLLLDRNGHEVTTRPPKNKKAYAKEKKERSWDVYRTDTDKKTTDIHLHRGLIEQFTINVSNTTDAAHIVKEKVQNALLEVLNSANLNT